MADVLTCPSPECGHVNVPGAVRCAKCGQPLKFEESADSVFVQDTWVQLANKVTVLAVAISLIVVVAVLIMRSVMGL